MKIEPYFVYKMCDPYTLEPKWIGSTRDPYGRFNNHLKKGFELGVGGKKKEKWVQAILKTGKRPVFIIHEWMNSKKNALQEEYLLIKNLKEQGVDLFNEVESLDWTPHHRKAVRDNSGNVYLSLLEAERKTGIPRGNIRRQIKGFYKTVGGGRTFEWIKQQ